ncbi:hypothetical protein A33M_4095 [Rhodovulum sp. PH10]|uniref:hypothetical protein n=1 Tax=Rhodovulum sp. PH10 TaxID=1187851 RepID=UPI00027C27FF|nr:hypothetical protein [Rhodovulum sp. PH10]EJW10759.1 hypothetical protein A33M_4095 [Rhodovulum sp. PH10]
MLLGRRRGMAFLRLIAKVLILWDERVVGGWRQDDPRLHSDFFDHFACDFPDEYRPLSRTDVDAAVECFLAGHKTLVDWYRTLIAPPGIVIEWRNRQPLISPACIVAWERLCTTFDPDSLLTLDLADRFSLGARHGQLDELNNWRTVVRVQDHELAALWRRGLSDLHIHVSGVRVPQLAWHELVQKAVPIDTFRVLAKIYEKDGRDIERDREEANRQWATLRSHAGLAAANPDLLRSTTDEWWRPLDALRRRERQLLLKAWSTVKNGAPRHAEIERSLDLYLSHKHRYFRLVRQGTFSSPPGLRQFDKRYFSALKRTSAKRPAVSYGTSPRQTLTPEGDGCRYLMESNDLRRIELRIAPAESRIEYLRSFKEREMLIERLKAALNAACAWGEGPPSLDIDRRFPDIRYAVHFKRTRGAPARGTGPVADAEMKMRELDRHTAALRAALSDPDETRRRWMRGLSRIDVAGQERDTPLALFAVYLRLLRGNPETLEFLEKMSPDDPIAPWFEYWRRLLWRGEHRPSLGESRIGLTVHAGEDFADLLDGLYQVGAAVHVVGLCAGDGIGHGLALTSEFEAFGMRAPDYVMMPLGTAHDSLCWLHRFVDEFGDVSPTARERDTLHTLIRETGEKAYAGLDAGFVNAKTADYVWLWENRVLPRWARSRVPAQRDHMLRKACSRPALLSRERMAPADPRRRDLDGLVSWARDKLMSQIKKERIVIEMNPGSNLRVSGAPRPQDSPTVRLFQAVGDGLLACINTDNPGVFTSCIENEYALLLAGAVESGVPEGRVRELLERVRQIGMELVYWPTSPNSPHEDFMKRNWR